MHNSMVVELFVGPDDLGALKRRGKRSKMKKIQYLVVPTLFWKVL